MTDVLFVNPNNSFSSYQGLSTQYSAIEPPTWALLLAKSIQAVGYKAKILDLNAEKLSVDEAIDRIETLLPRLICFVVYGQNPNSGSVNMHGAMQLADALKNANVKIPICAVGSHVSALPKEVLEAERSLDFLFTNEGVYALRNILSIDFNDNEVLKNIKGIGFRYRGEVVLTDAEKPIPHEKMDSDLPGYAWELLPYKDQPLDMYRAHFWHAEYDHSKRSPFAAIYTSLGCTFKCDFCMINIINRDDSDEIGVASNYAKMRFWSPEFVINEIETLIEMGVRTLRISDEMFLLNSRYFVPLCEMLRDRGYGTILNMWAYSRIDTVKSRDHLRLLKSAGFNWLAVGIESGDKRVRTEIAKGKFDDVDIRTVVKMIEEEGIEVIANYLFGLPADSYDSMNTTLELGLELCTMAWNGYPVMALPGSALYKIAKESGQIVPSTYSEYSFLGFNTRPIPTEKLESHEILSFRDNAFKKYHSHPSFIRKVRNRFGEEAVNNIREMLAVTLKRKIVEESLDN